MTSELAYLAHQWLGFALILAVQLLLILALRGPVRARLGAVACYRLWLLPLLWLPCYLLGPPVLAALAQSGAAAATASGPSALQRFLQIELLPFTVDLGSSQDFAAGGSRAFHGWNLLACIWVSGTLTLIAWHGCRWLLFSHQLHASSTALSPAERANAGTAQHFDASMPIVKFPRIHSAALYGVFKPVLLLPGDFDARYDANQRHIILAHEAVHLRRRDNGWNLLALLTIALFWTNPLLFVAWRNFRLDQELSCDALALRRCNAAQQKRYARTLLDSLDTHHPRAQPALSAWNNVCDIKERTLMIKQHLHRASRPATALASFMLLALCGASLTLVSAELVSPPVLAGEAADVTPPTGPVSEATARVFTQSIELLNDDQYAEARERLGTLDLTNLTPYERSRYEQLMFNLDMHDEDYAGARAHLQAALDSGGLNEQESAASGYVLAQLYVQEENYPAAVEALERWIATHESTDGAAYYLLAASYYYMDDFGAALPHAQRAVELAGDRPHRAWQALLETLRAGLGQQREAAEE